MRVWGRGPTPDSNCLAQVFIKLPQGKSLIMKSSRREIEKHFNMKTGTKMDCVVCGACAK